MNLRIYNTLSRKKEEFVPITPGEVRMYSCGPTVYNYAHIGNPRTYIFMDLLRRTLLYDGYKLKGVMNITDVGHLLSDGDTGEDKMNKAAKEQRKTPEEIAEYYSAVFFKDIDRLNILRPEIIAKATDNIPEMIDYVVALQEKGFAYETSDGIYFDISKFPSYGALSGVNLDEQIAGARVEVNGEKRHPADFALWKKATPEHIMQWDSPWGKGYPGWHIECSAMGRKFLGPHFDIHTGGVDHIPIHHENEIAQNEALTCEKAVNYWVHGEFMLVNNGKMSKSLGNTYTIDQLMDRGYSPMVFRYFCLNAHYRKKLNFTFDGMDAAKVSYERLKAAVARHKNGTAHVDCSAYKENFEAAINDDLNIPLAIGELWTMLKSPESGDVYEAAMGMDRVFGLDLDKEEVKKDAEVSVPD
ncbi:MAG: cysteine--tRNA ligase, partial [Christensenellales bacterium]